VFSSRTRSICMARCVVVWHCTNRICCYADPFPGVLHASHWFHHCDSGALSRAGGRGAGRVGNGVWLTKGRCKSTRSKCGGGILRVVSGTGPHRPARQAQSTTRIAIRRCQADHGLPCSAACTRRPNKWSARSTTPTRQQLCQHISVAVRQPEGGRLVRRAVRRRNLEPGRALNIPK